MNSADVWAVLGAIALVALGGQMFIKGLVDVSASLRVPQLLVATTLAAFATSSPELAVTTVAALSGQPEIGFGNVLGSNVVNITLIFGLALLFGPLQVQRHELGRDFGLALAAPVLTLWLARDGVIARAEGALLLLLFALWLMALLRAGLVARGAAQAFPHGRPWRSLALCAAGFAAMAVAGRLFVERAANLASAFGVDTFIIGATLVAIGTTVPELVTTLLSRLLGHDDVGIGLLLGSNVFNSLAIVGVAASIHPIVAPPAEIAVALGMGLLSLLLLIPARDGTVGRGRSLALLPAYAVFVAATVAVA